jgi:CBS domain-containing protein
MAVDVAARSRGDIIRRHDPIVLPETATVQAACVQMRDRRMGAVLVVGPDGRLAGLFTGRDVACRVAAEALDPTATLLYSVMTIEPDSLQPHVGASEALRMIREGGYRHLPVLDGSRVVGIVSWGDYAGGEPIRFDAESGFWVCEGPDGGAERAAEKGYARRLEWFKPRSSTKMR